MIIHITPNLTGKPADKCADAEIHFVDPTRDGVLLGHKLVGFAVWEMHGRYNVSFPSRQYSINGEKRSFALVRPLADHATEELRTAIIAAYQEWLHSPEGETHATHRS